MSEAIAHVSGIALVPGVSKNKRLYTAETIRKAVTRAQARIADGGAPITTLTHHSAGDDSSRICGRLTSVSLDEQGRARYEMALADTEHGRAMLNLIDTDNDGNSFLKGVSIRGAWLGPVRSEQYEGRMVDTADDLELDGLDFTKSPGVDGAEVTAVARVGAKRSTESADRTVITESADDGRVVFVESKDDDDETSGGSGDTDEKGAPALKSGKNAAAPTKAKKYADPGYQDDGAKRYALDTKAQARAAWSYINQSDNAKAYTADQLKRVKSRIVSALKGFGVTVNTKEGWIVDVDRITREVTDSVGESVEEAGVNISLDNGLFTLSFYSYRVAPADLDVIARAAMNAACDAVKAIDPDSDGDIDVAGATGNYDDRDSYALAMSNTPDDPTTETSGAATAPDEENKEEPAMAESTNAPKGGDTESKPGVGEAADAAASTDQQAGAPAGPVQIVFSGEQFQQFLDRFGGKPAESAAHSAPAEPKESAPADGTTESSETTPPAESGNATTTETEEQRIERLVEARVTAAIQDHAQNQGVARKGLVGEKAQTPEAGNKPLYDYPAGWPQKPMHEFTKEEQKAYWNPQLEGAVFGAVAGKDAE